MKFKRTGGGNAEVPNPQDGEGENEPNQLEPAKKIYEEMRGRPTKYSKDFCPMLVEYMSKGLSLEAFVARIGITRETLYQWVDKYPDFKHAFSIGKGASQEFWELRGIEAMRWGSSVNGTVWKFNMQNRFGWRDKKDIEHSGSGGGPIRYADATEDELDRRLKALAPVFNTLINKDGDNKKKKK